MDSDIHVTETVAHHDTESEGDDMNDTSIIFHCECGRPVIVEVRPGGIVNRLPTGYKQDEKGPRNEPEAKLKPSFEAAS